MYKIAVCDDDKSIANSIEEMILRLTTRYNHFHFQVDVFYSSTELECYLKQSKYDVWFLDINMPGLDGIEVAQRIREMDQNTIIIFVSSHKSYFERLFDVQPFNFIAKPIDWEKFTAIFEKAMLRLTNGASYFMFTSDRTTTRVLQEDIVVFETFDRKIILTTISDVYHINGTLKEIFEQLDKQKFVYVSQSSLVNMRHVVKIFPDYIILATGQKIFISRRKQNQVREEFKRLWQEDLINADRF